MKTKLVILSNSKHKILAYATCGTTTADIRNKIRHNLIFFFLKMSILLQRFWIINEIPKTCVCLLALIFNYFFPQIIIFFIGDKKWTISALTSCSRKKCMFLSLPNKLNYILKQIWLAEPDKIPHPFLASSLSFLFLSVEWQSMMKNSLPESRLKMSFTFHPLHRVKNTIKIGR